jgi:hypothetical protein
MLFIKHHHKVCHPNSTGLSDRGQSKSKSKLMKQLWFGLLLQGLLLAGWVCLVFPQSEPDTLTIDKKYEFRRQPTYEYSTRGRRDPFRPLIREGVEDNSESTLLNVDDATLTGVVWAGDQMVALFKDKKGKSFYMHKGDEVQNGRILEIKDNSVIVSLFGFSGTERKEIKVSEHNPNAGK